eukprot:9265061-Alexandrium_andersonii.AAC.1
MDLGTIQHISASAIYLFVFDGPFTGNVDSRIQAVWGELTEAYNRLGIPAGERVAHKTYLGIFESSRSYHPARYPQLHSKAAVARHT